jgi:hypothetical protein
VTSLHRPNTEGGDPLGSVPTAAKRGLPPRDIEKNPPPRRSTPLTALSCRASLS